MSMSAGWLRSTIGGVAETALGKMLDRGHIRGLPTVRYLRNINVQWGRIDTSDLLEMELADDERERFAVLPGDLLVCEGGEIGRCAIWRGDGQYIAYQKALHRLRPRAGVDVTFVRYLLEHLSLSGVLSSHSTGSTIAHLPQQRLREVPVLVPEHHEQQRIVEILEGHLSRLDTAEQTLLDQKKRLAALRSSTIRQALNTGVQAAVPLGSILVTSIGGVWGTAPGSDELDIRVIRVTELKKHGRIRPATAALRSISKKQFRSRELKPGDLLLEKSGGGPNQPVGRVGLIEHLDAPSVCSNFMQLMRPDECLALSRYLHLYLNAFHERGGTISMQTASTNIRNIKASEYLKVPVAIPSLEQQREALQRLEPCLEAYERITCALRDAGSRGKSLRQAVLAAALSGRLTGKRTDDEVIEELAQ